MVTIDIRPIQLTSAYEVGAFDEAYKALKKAGFRIISLAENAKLRTQQGKEDYVSENGNWVLEDAVYVPGKGNFLTKNGAINRNAKRATDAHRNNQDFYLNSRQTESALANSVNLPNANTEIPTNRFGEDGLTVFAFGNEADARVYGEFLRAAGINEIPVYVADKGYVSQQKKPFARKIWFSRLSGGSVLIGDLRSLGSGNDRVRGVFD